MKKKSKIVIAILASLIIIVGSVAGSFAIHRNYENNKMQAYLADTSNPPQALENPDEWKETFHDDFNFLDETKWKVVTFEKQDNIRRGAYYLNDDDIVYTKDGNLYISTKWKNGAKGEGWYSGYLTTSKYSYAENAGENFEGFSQNEGYFEVRCILPPAFDIWSAFWMMPDIKENRPNVVNSAADGIEIDIVESYLYNYIDFKRKHSILPVIHEANSKIINSASAPDYICIPDMYRNFHTYAVLWDNETYTFFLDGKEIWKSKYIVSGKDMGKCEVPEYLLLTTEVSGKNVDGKAYPGWKLDENASIGARIEHKLSTAERNSKNKSYDFIVDYVRCYQKIK